MQKHIQVPERTAVSPVPEPETAIDLVAVARTLWRGRWVLLAAVALAVLWAGYRTFVVATPLYTARTEMALQISAPPTVDLQSLVSGFSGDEASINTEMAVISSGELVARLVDELRLDEDPEFNGALADPMARRDPVGAAQKAVKAAVADAIRVVLPRGGETDAEAAASPADEARDERTAVVDAVRAAIETESSWDTYVFAIEVTSRDPEKAALIANTLARLYRDEQIRLKVEVTERMAGWLSGRVGELRAELDQREAEIADLRARSSLVSDESLQALNEQAIALRSDLSAVEGQVARLNERLVALRVAEAVGSVEARVEAADDGRLEAAARGLEEPGGEARFDRRFEQIVLQAEAERDRALERAEDLRREVEDLSAQFEGQSTDLRALSQLEQEAEAARALYETFLTRLKEATVQETAYEADSRLLTEAAPGLQVSPRPSRALALAILAGLVLGAAIVLGRELMQSTFRSADEIEAATGRTVLGQIPRIPGRTREAVVRYLAEKPASAAAEAVRNLRTSILLSDADRPPRVVMTTSSVPDEGKTTLAIALAQTLAGLDRKVLLIEGDIRRRTFDAYFDAGADDRKGLLAAVSGRSGLADAVARPGGMGIDVLQGGRSAVNAADLFSSAAFARVIEEARRVYDDVVIDTPPVLVVPDARVIAQHADAVIYVVRWDRTARAQVAEGLRQLRSVHASVAGLVLSRVDPKGMRRYGYGGKYGPYSRQGRRYYEA